MKGIAHEPADILRRASEVGTYYGFRPLSSLTSALKGRGAKAGVPDTLKEDALDPVAREVSGFLRKVRDMGLTPTPGKPLFLWHTNLAPGRAAPKSVTVQFHALGADRPIADAVTIRAARALAGDLGREEPVLRLNSMGDKETRGRLARELASFFRKKSGTLPEECAECAKKDVFAAAEMLLQGEDADSVPSPTDHLSEASRKHFEAVLEYLESTDTPYELAPDIFSRGGIWNETCFSLSAGEGVWVWGSRYTDLARHYWKTAPSSVGAVLRLTTEGKEILPAPKKKTSPRFVFVHIGDEAKRESIKMADTLRRAKIPVTQYLGIESLSEQMLHADEHNPRYLLIMGRKEALEGSVILRERATHTETFIPIASLIDELKAVS